MEKNKTKEMYDLLYEKYGDFPNSKRFTKLIIKSLNPKPNRKLIDVGCGAGHLLKEFEKLNLRTYGIDISKRIIELARKNCKGELKIADGEKIPYKDNEFDYVVSIGCLEHYNNTEKGIRELARILKPEGLALIYVPNTFFIADVINVLFKGDIRKHIQEVNKTQTKEAWKKLLRKNGLRIVSVKKNNVFAHFSLRKKFMKKTIYLLFQDLIPLNFCYHFIFLCKKETGK